MITSFSSSLSIKWDFSIDGAPFNRTKIQKIKVTYSEYEHDVAVIDVSGIPSAYLSQYADRPVYLKISVANSRTCYFYGYVAYIDGVSSSYEGLVEGSAFQFVQLVCFGSSYVLRSKKNNVWQNVTLPQLVKNVARQNRLAYSVPNNPYKFKRLIQSGSSVWSLLTNASRRLGYSITLTNGHIHVWDKSKSPARQPSFNILRGTKLSKINYQVVPGAIILFKPVVGKITPSGDFNTKNITYIDERGKVVKVNSSVVGIRSDYGQNASSRFSDDVSLNVTTFDDAKNVLLRQKHADYPYACEATVVGDPSIVPGGIVQVNGYESNFDGFWYVESVTHELVSENMVSYLRLSKDGDNQTLPKFPSVQKYIAPPLPILINNNWVAPKEFANVYN